MTPFGRYTLLRKLATGGMAEVFLARADGPMGFQKKCVVKRILPHFTDDPGFVDMFLAEARMAADLNHPNLVQIFDFGEVEGQYFIAMEYIEGPNLRRLNVEARRYHGPLALPVAARIVALAAEGLHFAHELKDEQGRPIELVHRDISPDNILVSRQGSVKVVDFGIAKAANQPHLTRSGIIKGKLAYMPPEQLAREPLDRRADIFALGVVLYELVSGEMPFDASSEVSIIQAIMGTEPLRRVNTRRGDVPPQLDGIVARCLEKHRDQRYASCRELMGDLERFIQASGQVVGAQEIAALVEQAMPLENEPVISAAVQVPPVASSATGAGALDVTLPKQASASRSAATAPSPVHRPDAPRKLIRHSAAAQADAAALHAPTQPDAPSEPREAQLSSSQVRAAAPSRTPLVVVGALALLGVSAGAVYAALNMGGAAKVEVLDAGPELVVAARAHGPVPTPTPTPTPPVVAEADAGSLAAPEEDAGAALPPPAPAVVDAGVATPPSLPPHQPHLAAAPVELRIRPYATVSIDGKVVGDTPLPPQLLTVGHHKIRLVNPTLGKDLVVDFTVKAGADNVFKYNLKE